MQETNDPLLEEMIRTQRDRNIIVIAAVIGIVASAVVGIGFSLSGLAASGPRNPGGLIFFVGPFAICMALGYAIHACVRRLR